MSTDFIGLFDITAQSLTPASLLEALANDASFARSLMQRYRDAWRVKSWMLEVSSATGRPQLLGPGGFAIHVGQRTVELYHTMRFATFTGEADSREALRQACLVVADLVGSARVIYTHELMPYEGETLEEIERGLRARIGPPASTFEELRAAALFGPRAWYVDTYADLRP